MERSIYVKTYPINRIENAIVLFAIVSTMPIGDPHGGNFEYTVEGLPETMFMASVPARDPSYLSGFYSRILRMEIVLKTDDEVYLRREGCRIRLFRSDDVGNDTGIFIGVEDPYDFRRRMMDEGVRFRSAPERLPMGVAASFYDTDGNVLWVIETEAEPKQV